MKAGRGGHHVDEIDQGILAALRENSRASFTAIAEQVGASEGTVRARMKRMVDDRVIEKFTIRTGAGNVKALVRLALESHADAASVAARIAEWPDVETVWEVTGDTDMVIVADCGTSRELNALIDRIRAIEGTKTTQSELVLSEH